MPFRPLHPALFPALLVLGTLALLAGQAPAQNSEPQNGELLEGGPLSLEQIMAHPEWVARSPQRPFWGWSSANVYYWQDAPTEDGFDPRHPLLYSVDLAGNSMRVEAADNADADAPRPAWSPDRTRWAFIRSGDLFVRELGNGALRQLTRTNTREATPSFLDDGRIAYVSGNDVYAVDAETGLLEQLFDVETSEDPLDELEEKSDQGDYLDRQQPRLLRWVDHEQRRELGDLERRRSDQAEDPSRATLPFFLGKDLEIGSVFASPDGRWAVVRTTPKKTDRGQADKMPQYVTASGYVEVEEVRPKVGTGDGSGSRLWLLDRLEHTTQELDLSVLPGIADDPLAELRKAAEQRRETQNEQEEEALEAKEATESGDDGDENEQEEKNSEPRSVRLLDLQWHPSSGRALFQAFSTDNKDRWLATIDVERAGVELAAVVPLHRMHDDAWINWSFRDAMWLPGSSDIVFLSEETGSSQLFRVASDGLSAARRLTTSTAVVDAPTATGDGRYIYFTANPRHPGVYDVYRVDTADGTTEAITDLGGRTSYDLSPDERRLALRHSTTTRPPELYVQEIASGAEPQRLTTTVSAAFEASDWVGPEIVEVPSSHVDGSIYARLYAPRESSAGGPRPAVVFVHGAGYLQNAHQGWSSYFREFMFHSYLVQRGFVVLDMDYRGSAGYGRDWRTAIYRQMGTPEVEDLIDGVDYLVAHHGVDRDRIGVYGGSYGGFLVFMSMFKEPDLFAAGAALRPVTDWAHYNHGYTSNILNTPEIDPEAYERSSPIELAEGLSKPLLICTGMLDDNVFFQDSVRLTQRLIELGKKDFEVAIYPIEPHGFREPSSWLDEYRRIFGLFERHLLAATP